METASSSSHCLHLGFFEVHFLSFVAEKLTVTMVIITVEKADFLAKEQWICRPLLTTTSFNHPT